MYSAMGIVVLYDGKGVISSVYVYGEPGMCACMYDYSVLWVLIGSQLIHLVERVSLLKNVVFVISVLH